MGGVVSSLSRQTCLLVHVWGFFCSAEVSRCSHFEPTLLGRYGAQLGLYGHMLKELGCNVLRLGIISVHPSGGENVFCR